MTVRPTVFAIAINPTGSIELDTPQCVRGATLRCTVAFPAHQAFAPTVHHLVVFVIRNKVVNSVVALRDGVVEISGEDLLVEPRKDERTAEK
jgi:hypothetical protein